MIRYTPDRSEDEEDGEDGGDGDGDGDGVLCAGLVDFPASQ